MARFDPFRDPERELYWNPALPTGPGAQQPQAAPASPASPAMPPTPAPAPAPKPDLSFDIAPPKIDAGSVSADIWGNVGKMNVEEPKAAPAPAPAKYEPGVQDFIGNLLTGFAGDFSPTLREQRWTREQQLAQQEAARTDRAQQAQAERQRRIQESQAKFGNWFAANAQRQKGLELAEKRAGIMQQNADTAAARQRTWAENQAILNDPNHPQRAALLRALEAQGVDTSPWRDLSLGVLRMQQQPLNAAVERAHAPEDIAIDAKRAGAVAGASTSARERAQLPYEVAREERSEGRSERSDQREIAKDQGKRAEESARKRVGEQSQLGILRQKLVERAKREGADASLPAQGTFLERGAIKARASVLGGTGMDAEDSILDNDLTSAGLRSYINTAGNAPNSEREQEVAGRTFRGDGTVAGAIRAIDERLRAIDVENEASGASGPAKRRRSVRANFGATTTTAAPAGTRVVGEDW